MLKIVTQERLVIYIYEEEAINQFCHRCLSECSLPDLDAAEEKSFCKRLKYRQAILKNLRSCFRSEYLGALIHRKGKKPVKYTINVGDMVMVGADNKKRIYWPLGRITQVIPGKDEKIRLLKVQTLHQVLLSLIQRVI